MINWQMFGSNGQEKADYSRGVLERFTQRASNIMISESERNGNKVKKNIANPRRINFIASPHSLNYFEEFYAINEKRKIAERTYNYPLTVDKIVINHYHCKSWEEYLVKRKRGWAPDFSDNHYGDETFNLHNRNEVFDDGILKYRAERAKIYQPPDASDVARTNERLLNSLTENLMPVLQPTTPRDFYAGKMETFLTCRAVSSYLKTKFAGDTPKLFEEASLIAILKSVAGMSLADARLLIRELPELLTLPYPVVKDLRGACLQIIPQMMNIMHLSGRWGNYFELDYIQRLLKIF